MNSHCPRRMHSASYRWAAALHPVRCFRQILPAAIVLSEKLPSGTACAIHLSVVGWPDWLSPAAFQVLRGQGWIQTKGGGSLKHFQYC